MGRIMVTTSAVNQKDFSLFTITELISVKQEPSTDMDEAHVTKDLDGLEDGSNLDDINLELKVDEIVKVEMDLDGLKVECDYFSCSGNDINMNTGGTMSSPLERSLDDGVLMKDMRESIISERNGPSTNDDQEMKNEESEVETKNEKMRRCVLCKEVEKTNWASVCVACHKSWRNQYLERFTTYKLGSCLICVNSVYNGINRIKHDCTSVSGLVCTHCDSIFGLKSHLIKHMKVRCGKNTCLQCNQSFCSRSEMKLHKCVSVNSSTAMSACSVCQKQLSNVDALKKHMRIHGSMKSKKHVCSVCNETFNNGELLKRHTSIHSNKNKFKCQQCSKLFSYRSCLNRHLASHENNRNYKCTFCTKSFNRSDNLKTHLANHENKRNYKCTFCTKSFNQSIGLKRHLASHENKKRYKCSTCNQSFNDSAALRRHLAIHMNTRNFKCTFCTKSFNDPSTLNKHVDIHENNRNYKCTFCAKSFNRSNTLNRHLASHSNKRNYECTLCAKSFNRLDCLNKHLADHNKNKKRRKLSAKQ